MVARTTAAIAVALTLLAGCSSGSEPEQPAASRASATAPAPASPAPATPAPEQPTAPATPRPPATFDAAAAVRHVRVLAGRIGPRLTTEPGFRRAARYVERRLRAQGYDVRRQRFAVPAGDSWGVPVRAGSTFNVVATPPGFDGGTAYRVVGAHLDTVAVAPGAEDNASGIAVLLELARLATAEGTALPTVLVAFGSEEPRGPGESMHHFGSTRFVRALSGPERAHLRAMVSLDRVGVGALVPVCHGVPGDPRVRDALLAAADAAGVAAAICPEGHDEASDHWSFEQAGLPAARLGSTPYAGYHSADDVTSVVEPRQLARTGRLIWAWLRPGRAS